MKKLHFLIALVLALALLLPLAIPAAAAPPQVLGYVSGATYGGPEKQPALGVSGKVTQLADGSLVGNWGIHFFKGSGIEYLADTQWKCDEFEPLNLSQYGMGILPFNPSPNQAAFMGVFDCVSNSQNYKGQYPWPIGFIITDVAEPGAFADSIAIFYGDGAGNWTNVDMIPGIEHGNFQVYMGE